MAFFSSLSSSFAFKWPSWGSLVSRLMCASTAVGSFTVSSPRTRTKFDFLIFSGGGGSRRRWIFACISSRASALVADFFLLFFWL